MHSHQTPSGSSPSDIRRPSPAVTRDGHLATPARTLLAVILSLMAVAVLLAGLSAPQTLTAANITNGAAGHVDLLVEGIADASPEEARGLPAGDSALASAGVAERGSTAARNRRPFALFQDPTWTSLFPDSIAGLEICDQVDVSVEVWNAPETRGFQFDLGFDPSVLEFVSGEAGPFMQKTGWDITVLPINVTPGNIFMGVVGEGDPPGPAGDGELARIRFEAVDGGESVLDLRNAVIFELDATARPVTSTDSVVMVEDVLGPGCLPTATGTPPTATASPTASPSPVSPTPTTPTPGDTPSSTPGTPSTPTVSPTASVSATTPSTGTPSDTPTVPPTTTEPSATPVTATPDDGTGTPIEPTQAPLHRIYAPWVATPGGFNASVVAAAPADTGIAGVVAGAASELGGLADTTSAKSDPAVASASAAAGDTRDPFVDRMDPGYQETVVRFIPESIPDAEAGDTVEFTVWIDNPVSLGAFQLTLTYPPSVLAFSSFELGPLLGSTGRNVIVLPPQTSPGETTIGAVSQPGAPGPSVSGELATVIFDVVGAGEAILDMSHVQLRNEVNEPMPATGEPAVVEAVGAVYLPLAANRAPVGGAR